MKSDFVFGEDSLKSDRPMSVHSASSPWILTWQVLFLKRRVTFTSEMSDVRTPWCGDVYLPYRDRTDKLNKNGGVTDADMPTICPCCISYTWYYSAWPCSPGQVATLTTETVVYLRNIECFECNVCHPYLKFCTSVPSSILNMRLEALYQTFLGRKNENRKGTIAWAFAS